MNNILVSNSNYLSDHQLIHNVDNSVLTELVDAVNLELGQKLELPWTASRLLSSTYEEHGDDLWVIEGGSKLVINGWTNLEEGLSWLSSDGQHLNGEVLSHFIQSENIAIASVSSYSEDVATVQIIKGDAWATDSNGIKTKLSLGDKISQGTVVETGENGFIKLVLVDKSILTLGNQGRYAINDFSFDGQSQAGVTLMSILKGAFSFVSGLIAREDPENVRIFTPTAEIGIRGTKIIGEVSVDGETEITLIQGRIVVYTESETYQIVIPLSGIRISGFTSSLIKFESIGELFARYSDAVPGQLSKDFLNKELESSFAEPNQGAVYVDDSVLPQGLGIKSSAKVLELDFGGIAINSKSLLDSQVIQLSSLSDKQDELPDFVVKNGGNRIITQAELVEQSSIVLNPVDKTPEKSDASKGYGLKTVEENVPVATKKFSDLSYIKVMITGNNIDIYFNFVNIMNQLSPLDYIQQSVPLATNVYKYELSKLHENHIVLQDYVYGSKTDEVYFFVGLDAFSKSEAIQAGFDLNPPAISESTSYMIVLLAGDIQGKDGGIISDQLTGKYFDIVGRFSDLTDIPELTVFYGYAPAGGQAVLSGKQHAVETKSNIIDSYKLVYDLAWSLAGTSSNRITDFESHALVLEIEYRYSPKIYQVHSDRVQDGFSSNLKYVKTFVLDLNISNQLALATSTADSIAEISDKLVVTLSNNLSELLSQSLINAVQQANSTSPYTFKFELHITGELRSPDAKYEINLNSNSIFFEAKSLAEQLLVSKSSLDFEATHESSSGVKYDFILEIHNDLDTDINSFVLHTS